MSNEDAANDLIGKWVYRQLNNLATQTAEVTTTAHKVESAIRDRAITRCGRQMHYNNRNGFLTPTLGGEVRCKTCSSLPERPQRTETAA